MGLFSPKEKTPEKTFAELYIVTYELLAKTHKRPPTNQEVIQTIYLREGLE
jgi:hypothetical protein